MSMSPRSCPLLMLGSVMYVANGAGAGTLGSPISMTPLFRISSILPSGRKTIPIGWLIAALTSWASKSVGGAAEPVPATATSTNERARIRTRHIGGGTPQAEGGHR